MMLGFDNDDPGIFDRQLQFVREARIVNVMVGMLSAIPKTPLHARLKAAGRLDTSDQPEFGTNVIPLGMSRDALRDGYVGVLRDLYDPRVFRSARLTLSRWRHDCRRARPLLPKPSVRAAQVSHPAAAPDGAPFAGHLPWRVGAALAA
jgi:Domain of unknown function (DUF4070)